MNAAPRRDTVNPAFEATATLDPADCGCVPHAPAPSRWPAWMRRLAMPLREPEGDARDRSTGLYNRAGLFAVIAEAIRMDRGDKALGMVVVEFSDLHEVYQIYGATIARKVVARIVRRLRSIAGLRGFVGRTGTAQFTIVLPGMTQERACRAVQRALGLPARVEFDAGDSEIVLVPHILVDEVEPEGGSIQPAYQAMCRELARMQKDECRRLRWLTSERERHSRPMSLPQD
jgi:GGDEF domain-containing protein